MKYIAVDLGAGSGRIVAGTPAPLHSDPPPASGGADDGLDILYRFTTPSVLLPTGIHWDIAAIFNNIKTGLRAAFLKYGDEIVSISVDSWGVDYGLLDAGAELIGLPYHYRDQRTDTIMEEVFSIISERDIYERTGIQFMQLNTLFQQIAFMKSHPDLFSCTRSYLSIPDLIIYWLCGEMTNERTHASTTQLFSPHQNTWDRELMDILKLPKTIFREIVPSGTPLAPLLPQVQQEVGAPASVQVIAGAGHDTQAASFTVPASADTAFLSCGTWSVMGIESSTAIISDTGFAYSASNEASARGGYNLLKNLLGLWLLQECKAEWDAAAVADSAMRAAGSGRTAGTGYAARAAGTAGAAESDYAKL
ncbi:MAG: FGGY family carbohydrate kinase, partial [Salinispira sp.]